MGQLMPAFKLWPAFEIVAYVPDLFIYFAVLL
jgi:hypothetical protein